MLVQRHNCACSIFRGDQAWPSGCETRIITPAKLPSLFRETNSQRLEDEFFRPCGPRNNPALEFLWGTDMQGVSLPADEYAGRWGGTPCQTTSFRLVRHNICILVGDFRNLEDG
jgi:hypothetical protein